MKRNGFTLIELMITVAVVGLLAAVALPSYNGYLARGRITDTVALLSDYRVKMEQFFQDNRNYGTASTSCAAGTGPALPVSQYFTFTCTVGAVTPTVSYVMTAASIAGALGVAAGDYTYAINALNAKSTSKFKGTAVVKACWLIRGNEC